MKKKLGLILSVAAALTASLAFAACDKTIVVSFDSAYGSGVEAQIAENGKIAEPTAPTRDGYTFGGWFKDAACTEPFSFDETVGESLTLHAKWDKVAENFTVHFVEGDGTEVADSTVAEGETVSRPAAPTRDGYTFDGWYTDEALTQTYDFSAKVTGELWLFAKWNPVVHEENGFVYSAIGSSGTYMITAKEGYAFADKVVIPSTYAGAPVIRVGDMKALTASEVVIENGIRVIDAQAFENNTSIEILELKGRVSIGEHAFSDTNLIAVDLGEATEIGDSAFENTKLIAVMVPASTVKIGVSAFRKNDTSGEFEISFAGDIPTIGRNALSAGDLTTFAAQSALDKLVEGNDFETDEEKMEAIENALQAMGFTGGLYNLSDEDRDTYVAYEGIYRGDALIYVGMGRLAVIVTDDEVCVSDLYGYDSVFFNKEDGSRDVYKIDAAKWSTKKLTANPAGEVIDGSTLYDYVGTAIVYDVPEGITRVAAGAGVNNSSIRFLSFADSVKSVGSYAFSTFISNGINTGTILSVSFGSGIERIEADALFGQGVFAEIIFRGEHAPVIEDGAFTYSGIGGSFGTTQFSSVLYSQLALEGYGTVKIWTPLSTTGDYDYNIWDYGPAPCLPFVDAFNASLRDCLIYNADDELTAQTITTKDFGQLKTSGVFAKGTEYYTDFGKIIMSGTDSGYTLCEFTEDGEVTGYGYVYIGTLPGYGAESDPKHITVYTEFSDGEMKTFDLYASFDMEDMDLNLRGAEAGTYGDVNSDLYVLDGYGKVTYYSEDGATNVGSYTVGENGAITIEGITGLTEAKYDSASGNLTVGAESYIRLGEEAGVYYDIANGAKAILDGRSTKEYDGTITLTFKGKTVSTTYIIIGSKFMFTLNGQDKEWTYNRNLENLLEGYYGDYEDNLKFSVVETRLAGTYRNGDTTVTLDGYYTIQTNGKEYIYKVFGDSSDIVYADEAGAVYILQLDEAAKTYVFAAEQEAGVYYVSSGTSYRLYLDGKGNLIYFDGVDKQGTYTYTNGKLHTNIGEKTPEGTDGELDTERGVGTVVYEYYGLTYVAISKEPFAGSMIYGTANWFELGKDGKAVSNSQSIKFSVSGKYAVVGIANQFFFVDSGLQEGDAFGAGYQLNTSVTFLNNDRETTLKLQITVESGDYGFTLSVTVEHESQDIKTVDGIVYQFIWLKPDKSVGAVLKAGELLYSGSFTWDGNNFHGGEVGETGYFEGVYVYDFNDNDAIEIWGPTRAIYYKNADGAEIKYNRITIFSRDRLWVYNPGEGGVNHPEVVSYTKTVEGGVTYYTFTSTVTKKVVKFHIDDNEFVVDSETDPA